mgnify:CR=1 FL=1
MAKNKRSVADMSVSFCPAVHTHRNLNIGTYHEHGERQALFASLANYAVSKWPELLFAVGVAIFGLGLQEGLDFVQRG